MNVKIIREADGIVTNLDCHNIKIFAQSDYLFYLPKVIDNYYYLDNDTHKELGGYSSWLKIYTKCLEANYIRNKHQIYDLLAGTFGFRLTLKEKYYKNSVDYIRRSIEEVDPKCVSIYTPPIVNVMDTGFDEILLLHLFRDFVI